MIYPISNINDKIFIFQKQITIETLLNGCGVKEKNQIDQHFYFFSLCLKFLSYFISASCLQMALSILNKSARYQNLLLNIFSNFCYPPGYQIVPADWTINVVLFKGDLILFFTQKCW
jgi:hypothetical protein